MVLNQLQHQNKETATTDMSVDPTFSCLARRALSFGDHGRWVQPTAAPTRVKDFTTSERTNDYDVAEP
jgi:hypothetical protein